MSLKPSKIVILALSCFLALAGTQCTVNHHQGDFEKQALQPPAGVRAMNATGKHVPKAESDPSDWRIAPDFGGLFEVIAPAFPNPVSYNSSFEITINVKAVNAIGGLYVYAFQQPSDLASATPLTIISHMLSPGLHPIEIKPQQFARKNGTGNFGNLYRIIFLDGRQNIITYGDVQVK